MTAPARDPGGLVRPGEGGLLLLCGAFAFLSVGLAIVLRTWSDVAFLDAFAVDRLPGFFMVSAAAFVPATLGYAYAVRRAGARGGTTLNTLLLGGAAAFAAACAVAEPRHGEAVYAVVLAMTVASPLVNVVCWNTILDRLDGRQCRRLVPLIGGIATVGAITAGLGGAELSARLGADSLLYVALAATAVMVPLPRLLAGGGRAPAAEDGDDGVRESFRAGLRAVGRNRLLVVTAAGAFLMAVTTNVVDYVFKARVQEAFDKDAMGWFLGRFHGVVNAAVLACQLVVVPRVLRRWGVAAGAMVHPGAVLLGTAAVLALPGLAAVVAVRFADTLLKFTFEADTHEMIVAAAPAADRRQAKVLIKGIVYPVGGFVAGLLLTIVTDEGHAALLAAGSAGLWLAMARTLAAQYAREVAARLHICVSGDGADRPVRSLAEEARDEDRREDLLWELRDRLDEIQALRRVPDSARNHAVREAQLHDALDGLFGALGELVGDAETVAAASERYLHGGASERARAVDLLDSLIHRRSHGLAAAAELLDVLAAEVPAAPPSGRSPGPDAGAGPGAAGSVTRPCRTPAH